MTPEVATRVMGYNSSKKLWNVVNDLFATHNWSNVIYYKREFQKTPKGGMKMDDYLNTMQTIADNLGLDGHPVEKKDFVSQILVGRDSNEYNPIVYQIIEKQEITWVELQVRLLNYEKRLEQINGAAATLSINVGHLPTNNSSNRPGNNQNKQQCNFSNQGRFCIKKN